MAKEAFIGFKNKKPFFYPLQNLTKHFIALGASGSGKTVLSKVFIEESALKHVPSIVVDIQGDLASLAIAGTKKDLETHNLDKEVVDRWKKEIAVTIYTPLSSKGVSICINPLEVPSKDIEREELVPMLHEISTAFAKLLGYNPDNDKGKFASSIVYAALEYSFTKRKPIKTFSKLITLLKKPPVDIQRHIDDLSGSEKELEVLTRKIKFLDVGEKKLLFQFGVPLNIDILLGRKVESNKTHVSILYLNTLPTHEEKEFFVATLANKLYQWMLSHPSKDLQANLMIDEIAPFIPAGSEKPISKPPLKLLFKQARKYGVGCLIATQNPGDIDYKAFAQFGTWAVGRLTVKQDTKKVGQALKSLSSQESIEETLPKLQPGEFIMFAPDISDSLIRFNARWLYTKHATLTEEDIKHIMSGKKVLFKEYDVNKPKKKRAVKKVSESVDGDDKEKESSIKKISKKASKKIREKVVSEFHEEQTKKHNTLYIHSVGEEHIRVLAQRKLNRLFKWFGPTNEHILDITKEFHPYLVSSIKVEYRYFLGFFKTQKVFNICVDGRSGELLKINNTSLKRFSQTEKLFSLTEQELQVARIIDQSKSYVSENELSAKTLLNKQSIKSTLNALFKKKIITFERVGKFKRWYSSISLDHDKVSKIASQLSTSYNKPPSKLVEPKISDEAIEKFVRLWFDRSIMLNCEIAYAPLYTITYASDKTTRKIEIDGITANVRKL